MIARAPQEQDEDDGLRAAVRRLRWRLSGAWLLPTFALCVLVETPLLHELPIAGESTGIVGAFLLAGVLNLIVMAAIAPGAGLLLRRRTPSLPKAVASDRAGTGLLLGLLVVLAVIGVLHHGDVVKAGDDEARQLAAARSFVRATGEPEYVAHLDRPSVWRPADFLFRTCFPGKDPAKNLCVYVDMTGDNPVVRRDPDQQPNSVIAGADNPGRRGR